MLGGRVLTVLPAHLRAYQVGALPCQCPVHGLPGACLVVSQLSEAPCFLKHRHRVEATATLLQLIRAAARVLRSSSSSSRVPAPLACERRTMAGSGLRWGDRLMLRT